MSGESEAAASEDRRIVTLAAGRSIALRLHVGFAPALLQHLGREIRRVRSGRAAAGCDAVGEFAARCSPIEILRWGEYAARDAADFDSIPKLMTARAREWAESLVAAMAAMEGAYRGGDWPAERAALLETQDWLAATLPAVKDDILLGIRSGLMIPEDEQPVDVVLVRGAYDQAGGHSHPALVDTARFAGADLVETLFHEIGHELLDRSIGHAGAGINAVSRMIAAAPPAPASVYEILHLALFVLVGGLVRQFFAPAHQPLIHQGTRLIRQLQKMGLAAARDDAVKVLDDFAAGALNLEELAAFFARP